MSGSHELQKGQNANAPEDLIHGKNAEAQRNHRPHYKPLLYFDWDQPDQEKLLDQTNQAPIFSKR